MAKKEWIGEFQGHSICVTNSWFGGAKLSVDGECRDTNNKMFANPEIAALSTRLEKGKADSPLVEVFVSTVLSVKVKICVDGKQIAGDAL